MSSIVVSGDTSGSVTLSAPAVSGSSVLTLPVATDTLVGKATTDTLTNKTLTSPTLTTPALGTPASGILTSCTGVNYDGFKSRIINGAMVIDQRNAGASVTPVVTTNTYIVDRFTAYQTQSSKFTVQQNAGAVTPPAGFTNYLGVTSSSTYSVISSDIFQVSQFIEGYNIADLGYGSANAQTITLSFWVRSSLTGTFGGALSNSAYAYSYPYTYTISTANTWEYKTVTITGATSGTWLTTNGIGIRVYFAFGVGSDNSGTAGSWSANGYASATGATSVVGTNGATFYITGVQLEKGATATAFDYRPYASEYFMCCRYFRYWGFSSAIESQTDSSSNQVTWQFPQPMRTLPTLVRIGNLITGRENGSSVTPYQYDASSGSASGTECYIFAQNSVGGTTPVAIGGRGSATAEL